MLIVYTLSELYGYNMPYFWIVVFANVTSFIKKTLSENTMNIYHVRFPIKKNHASSRNTRSVDERDQSVSTNTIKSRISLSLPHM